MRTALYARVSTLNGMQDPETQLVALREYCQRRGWDISTEYIDKGFSGAKESRPALNRLLADAKKRKFDVVLVWKLDRFGRSLKHLVNSLAEFEALGIAFVSMTDSLDMTTPQGRLMFGIIAAMTEFERALIVERVRAGIKRAQADAAKAGRKRGAGRKALPLDIDAIKNRMMFGGESVQQIAASLSVSRGAIYKRLKAGA